MVSIDWGWGNAVVAKDFIEYGYAKSGNLVLSNKAPSIVPVSTNKVPLIPLSVNSSIKKVP